MFACAVNHEHYTDAEGGKATHFLVRQVPVSKQKSSFPEARYSLSARQHHISDFLIEYARLMVDSGANLICIADPTASGEILGPKTFEEYAVRYLNKIIDGIHAMGAPVIVHICGKMKTVMHLIPGIRSDAISVDAMVSLRSLKQAYPQLTTMGNVSTYLLEFGTAAEIAGIAERLVRDGVDIISPACGLSTATSLENIRAMTAAVRSGTPACRRTLI